MKAKILFNRLIDGETNVNEINLEYGEGFINNDGKLYVNFNTDSKKISDLKPVGNIEWDGIGEKIDELKSSVDQVKSSIETINKEPDIRYGVSAPVASDGKRGDIYIQYSDN